MKNDMKVIMESWRRLAESEEGWNMSKDSDTDRSKKTSIIVFDEKDISSATEYPKKGKPNHGFFSHANKHAHEFGLDTLGPFMNYVNNHLKSGKFIYIRAGKSQDFLEIDLELLNKIKSKDKETRNFVQTKGQNFDQVYNALFTQKNSILTKASTIDFYIDMGNQKLADALMGSADQQYHQLSIKHHKDCENTYSDQDTSKTWCVDDDSLSISYGDKLSTLYKPKNISKALSTDRTLTNLIDKLKKTGNEKEIERINNKLKL